MKLIPLWTLSTLALLAFAPAARAEPPPLAVLAEGEPFAGEFTAVVPPWTFRFAGPDGPRDIAAADLATWGAFVEPQSAARVILPGGGALVASDVRIEKERIEGTSPTFGKLSLPIERVAGIVFQPPLNARAGDLLLGRVLDPTARGDRLLLENGDELAGTLATKDDRLLLDSGGDPWEVKFDALRAIAFDPTLIDKPAAGGLRCVVGFQDGSRATARDVTTEGQTARLKLAGDVELAAPIASIAALKILGGRVQYLSDMKPAGYRHIPYLELSWPYRNDQSVLGSQLRAGGRLYLKGLGMHSPARLTYELDRPYRRFEAQVAIDDGAAGRGSVVFRVFVDDGSGKWQERSATGIVRGGDPPQPLSVDLEGVQRISLLVDFADRGDELDHANWLDARLVR